jgi:hypothetical protein
MKHVSALVAAALFTFSTSVAQADEGMWTFDNFPSASVGSAHGFAPSHTWLDHVRASSVRIAGGCSASFVSPQGLIMTNHHCAVECAEELSSPTNNFVQNGFYAKTASDEKTCPGMEIDQLETITNVTQEMIGATKGLTGAAYTAALRAENAKLQQACGTNPEVRCDVVSLYHGGVYDVYRYHRYRDVRLVFVPEFSVGQFGGDPDNFNFPRFGFDVSFVRAYENGKPASTPQYLRWSKDGSKAGDLVFVAGNPGSTQRELTVAELAYLRDEALPRRIAQLAELRGLLEQYQTEGAEQLRTSKDALFYTENSYKVFVGQLQALDDPAFFKKLVDRERALRAEVNAKPALRTQYGDAWNKLAALQEVKARLDVPYAYKSGAAFRSPYFRFAQTLVRLPVEKAKPNAQRLPEFSDAALVTLPQEILDPSPIYPGLEEVTLTYAFDEMRREFGPNDPFVKAVLGDRTPRDEAHYLVSHTKLGDVAYRKQLMDGGAAAIAASNDPFIELARRIDPQARAVRKNYEEQVLNPSRQLSEEVAKARFAIDGTSDYPDATFTPRLSFGVVKGFTDEHGTAAPYTTFGGLFARANGADPYILPQSWLTAKPSLNLSTPLDLSTTNDIIGGNSGSPLISEKGEVVGLIFDGNIHSLGGAFGYDSRLNRSVALDSRAIMAGLAHVYHADRIVNEILAQ